MEIDVLGPLLASNGYTHILTAIDKFSRYLFAVPLRKPDTTSAVKALLSVFAKHAYVPTHILTDKGSLLTADLFEQPTKAAGEKNLPCNNKTCTNYRYGLEKSCKTYA